MKKITEQVMYSFLKLQQKKPFLGLEAVLPKKF